MKTWLLNREVFLACFCVALQIREILKSDFLKLSPPWVTRDVLFARRKLLLAKIGSHVFVSWPISSIKSFTDSRNYALSDDTQFYAVKWGEVGAVTRKYDAAREKGGDNFKKSDFIATDEVKRFFFK